MFGGCPDTRSPRSWFVEMRLIRQDYRIRKLIFRISLFRDREEACGCSHGWCDVGIAGNEYRGVTLVSYKELQEFRSDRYVGFFFFVT